jgi:methionine synthase II (cobalamin-independent)
MSAACPGRPICWPRFAPAPRARRSRARRHAGRAVAGVVKRQRDTGIDIVNDGEFGKPASQTYDYAPWWNYAFERLDGFSAPDSCRHPSTRNRVSPILALTSFANRRDWKRFGEFYQDQSSGLIGSAPTRRTRRPVCTGPIRYKGQAHTKADIDNLKQAMAANGIEEGFITSVAPASFARAEDLHYSTEEDFVVGAAEAMREEYRAIVDAGLILQIDDPSLSDNWDMIDPEPPLAEYKKFALVRIEALNHALRGLPEDRIRYHICWGSWHGPHTTDIPLADILDVLLRVRAGRVFGRGRQRPPRARVAGLAGRCAAGRQAADPWRGQPRHQCCRASAPGRRPDRQICAGGRPRERHRLEPTAASAAASIRRSPGPSSRLGRGRRYRQQGAVAVASRSWGLSLG